MSIVFVETGTRIVPYAIDENDLHWFRVSIPRSGQTECYGCDKLFVSKNDPDEHREVEGTVVATDAWYSVYESVLYCDNCITLP